MQTPQNPKVLSISEFTIRQKFAKKPNLCNETNPAIPSLLDFVGSDRAVCSKVLSSVLSHFLSYL